MNRHINLPPTEEGAKLLQSLEKNGICGNGIMEIVYEKAPDSDVYLFKCEYDDKIIYGDKCIIVPVTSTYKGTEEWRGGQEFANVLKSHNDKGWYKGNQKRWEDIYNAEKLTWVKYERPEFYDCINDALLIDDKYICLDRPIVGGHSIKGKSSRRLNDGDDVYIVPICQQHNTVNVPHGVPNSTPGNGNGFYMKLKGDARQKIKVLVMTGYVKMSEIKDYIK